MIEFETVGWQRISIEEPTLDDAERRLKEAGTVVRPFPLAEMIDDFRRFLETPFYQGRYRTYGGVDRHCLLEKALEHFVSFRLISPQPGMTGIDIGSCQSVVPAILREEYHCRCYEQDLEYSRGVNGDRIGSSADGIPLPGGSVDFMTLHCTFEHFEGSSDTGFVHEAARLLKPGGKVVVLPLYLNSNYCNITGECDPLRRETIGFDADASYHCLIPEWRNRFGRHYSPSSLIERVLSPSLEAGLKPAVYRVLGWEAIDPALWLRWILVLSQP